MDKLNINVEPYTFTTSAFLIGIALTTELSELELVSVGNWFQLIGLTMQTYAEQKGLLAENKNSTKEPNLDSIKKTISKIQEKLNEMK